MKTKIQVSCQIAALFGQWLNGVDVSLSLADIKNKIAGDTNGFTAKWDSSYFVTPACLPRGNYSIWSMFQIMTDN